MVATLVQTGLWLLVLGVPIAALLALDLGAGRRLRLRSRDVDVQGHEQQVAGRLGTR